MISSSRFSTSAGSTPGLTVASTSNIPTRWNGCTPAETDTASFSSRTRIRSSRELASPPRIDAPRSSAGK